MFAPPTITVEVMSTRRPISEAELETLQRETFDYFMHEANPANGLIVDKTEANWPASIAATGLALAAYPVGIERGFLARSVAAERTLTTLRFFWNSPQGPEPDATGHRGFYYHFLDMQTGRRVWDCEVSTIDSAFLLAGALTAGAYFDAEVAEEREIRGLADALYRRADWAWAQNGEATVTHGWRPESGFIDYRWKGYDEALLLYVLGLASPTHPLPQDSYDAWTSTFRWEQCYGYDYLYAGPLFAHQLSHVWIDFRGIQDAFMRDKGIDYFENSRRATYVQQRYAIENPRGFKGYGPDTWGLSAGINTGGGRPQPRDDNGTINVMASLASMPYTPQESLAALKHYYRGLGDRVWGIYGFHDGFNETQNWYDEVYMALNQAPVTVMIENHRTGMLWNLFMANPEIRPALDAIGFVKDDAADAGKPDGE